MRFSYTDKLQQFIDRAGWQDIGALTPRAEMEEAWFLGLRLNAGVRLNQLQADFGEAEIARFLHVIADLEEDGLLHRDADRIALTDRGRLLSNEVFRQILEVGDEELCPAN